MWIIGLPLCFFSVLINVQEILIVKFGLYYLSYIDEAFALAAYIAAPCLIRKRSDSWVFIILLLP